MSQSYESHGTTFLYNPGLDGNVTIMSGDKEITVSGESLLELAAQVLGTSLPSKNTRTPPTTH